MGPPYGRVRLGYVYAIVVTRDAWMHRIDIARAVGGAPELSADHDGRLIADLIADWGRLHRLSFALRLTGPAGGDYVRRDAAEAVELDAVEFVRILSGRAAPTSPLLGHALPL